MPACCTVCCQQVLGSWLIAEAGCSKNKEQIWWKWYIFCTVRFSWVSMLFCVWISIDNSAVPITFQIPAHPPLSFIPTNVLVPLQAAINQQATSARKLDHKTGGGDSKLHLVLPSCSTDVVLVPSSFHIHHEGCFLFNPKPLNGSYCL